MENWKVAPMIKAHIDGLRAGKVKDTNDWVVPVRIPEGVEV
jgi:hypothetical protein